MGAKKGNYFTKKVKFLGKDLTMYSLDGITWSSRPEELQTIIDRHSTEQAAFSSDLKGEERDKDKEKALQPKKKFAKVHNDDEIDEVIDEDQVEEDDNVDLEDVDLEEDIDSDEDLPKSAGKKDKGDKKGKNTPPPIASKKTAPMAKPTLQAGKKDKKAEKVKSKPTSKSSKAAKPAPKAKKNLKNVKSKKKAA